MSEKMSKDQRDLLTEGFLKAFYEGVFPGDRTFDIEHMTIDEAYEIQDQVAEKRIENNEKVMGYKVGCTSKAIQEQFGLAEPISGRLFAPHIFNEGVELFWDDYTNCAIEPEMVLILGKDLCGENLSDDELIAGIKEVRPGVEIHQFKFWFSPTTSQELICSGGIHSGLVVGNTKADPSKLSFAKECFSVFKDREFITSGLASEIMGGPIRSLRWLVGCLTRKGECLKAGSYVIPGSPVELVNINRDVKLTVVIDNVGSLTVDFKSRNPDKR